MAFVTVGGYLQDVRTLLQDRVQPYRYSTTSLVYGLNLTLLEVRRLRPDLLASYLDNVPQYEWTDEADQTAGVDQSNPTYDAWVPIEQQFRQALVFGISGHAMRRDQEDIEDERATADIMTFENMLTEVKSTKGMQAPKG